MSDVRNAMSCHLLGRFVVGLSLCALPALSLCAAPELDVSASAPVSALLKSTPELVSWLKQHHQEVAAAASRVAQAKADVGQSRAFQNPSLDFTFGDIALGRTNPAGLGLKDTVIATTSLSQTFELGKRGPRIASKQLSLEAAQQTLLDTLSQKVADARYALGRVVYLQTRQSVLEESLDSSRNVSTLEKVRMDQGDLSGNDYDRLLLDNLALEGDVTRNRAELDAAMADCRAVMFATCVVDRGDMESLAAAVDIPAVQDLDNILARRPDILATTLARESARQEAILARRKAIPDPNIGVGYTLDKLTISGDQPSTVFVSLGIPLPVFDHGQHEARGAEARANELDHNAGAALMRSRADVDALLSRRSNLENTLKQVLERGVPKSDAVLATTQKAFDRGQASLTDLLLARKTHTGLLVTVLDLKFEVFNVHNDLRRTLGLDADLARQSS